MVVCSKKAYKSNQKTMRRKEKKTTKMNILLPQSKHFQMHTIKKRVRKKTHILYIN